MDQGRRDAGISDIAGTLMMVGVVVLAGGAMTAVVTDSLSTPSAPAASLALAPIAAGDVSLRLALKHGNDLPLAQLSISLQRDAAPSEQVPRSSWSTVDPLTLRAGDAIVIPLSPGAVAGERLKVDVFHADPSATLASLSATAGSAPAALAAASLTAEISPSSLFADGSAAARVTVLVSHPAGTATVAALTADLHALDHAAGTANTTTELNDAGVEGDAIGGDGIWTALVRPSRSTPVGVYDIPLNATDLDGRRAGSTSVALMITGNLSNGTDVSGGTCYGCLVVGGTSSYEGTRLQAPTSENVTQFRLRNWTWDELTPVNVRDDALVIRVVNESAAWSMYFKFDHVDGQPCIVKARAWTGSNETFYEPYNGTCLPLAELDLDLMDPVASQQLKATNATTNVENPFALYRSAEIFGKPTFILAYLRDEDPTGQDELSQEIGVFSMDVVIR